MEIVNIILVLKVMFSHFKLSIHKIYSEHFLAQNVLIKRSAVMNNEMVNALLTYMLQSTECFFLNKMFLNKQLLGKIGFET